MLAGGLSKLAELFGEEGVLALVELVGSHDYEGDDNREAIPGLLCSVLLAGKLLMLLKYGDRWDLQPLVLPHLQSLSRTRLHCAIGLGREQSGSMAEFRACFRLALVGTANPPLLYESFELALILELYVLELLELLVGGSLFEILSGDTLDILDVKLVKAARLEWQALRVAGTVVLLVVLRLGRTRLVRLLGSHRRRRLEGFGRLCEGVG